MGYARHLGGALLALAWLSSALALAANAEGADAPEPRPAATLSARVPLRALALDRLPPGTRPAAERAQVERVTATYGERLVERVRRVARAAGSEGGSADWLEVEYTVDPRLEDRLRGVFEQDQVALAHVILMDPESGEVFAYVSSDPERFPATRAYPTASLMKIVTAAALLRHAPAAAQRMCHSFGSPYEVREDQLGGGGHAAAAGLVAGPQAGSHWIGSFRSALAISNNQCFARYAVHDLGQERLLDEIDHSGLLEPPAQRHPSGRLIPIQEPLDLANLGSGLAGSAISPLAGVRLAALLATGELVTPSWIAQVRDAQGIALGTGSRSDARRVWDAATADELRGLLEGVTRVGTASRAFHGADGTPRLGPVRVSGKTGTLLGTHPDGLYQWFVGVAPTEQPRIAIATLVVHTGPRRGTSASALAAASLEQVFCSDASQCSEAGVEVLYARASGRASQVERGLREAVASAQPAELGLDEPLRPLGDTTLRLPRHLLREKVRGEVALRVDLDPRGRVSGVAVESSDLSADFEQFLVEEVRGWRFTPPRRAGQPVTASVRLPIPIRVD